MPGASDNVVTITIQTVDASSGAISNVETKLNTLGTTGAATATKLKEVGAAGATIPKDVPLVPPVPPEVPKSLDDVLSRELAVRLAAEETGIRIPLAMQRIIAGNSTLMAGLQATSALFVGMASVAIFEQMAEGAYHLYEKWFDVTKAVEAYQLKAAETAEQKLFDSSSLETEISLLKQAQDEVDRLHQKQVAAGADKPGGGLTQYGRVLPPEAYGKYLPPTGAAVSGFAIDSREPGKVTEPYSSGNDEQAARAQQNLATAQQRTDALHHQAAVESQKAAEAYNSTALTGFAKIEAENKDRITTAQMELAYTKQQEQTLQRISEATLAVQKAQRVPEDQQIKVYQADPKAGNDAYDRAARIADQTRSAQHIAMARTERDQTIAMQAQAVDAGMRGEALYDEQRQQALDAVTRKYWDHYLDLQTWQAQTAAVDEKFHNEKMKRLEEEQYQTARIHQEAAGAGFTGVAQIRADEALQVKDLRENPANEELRDKLGATGIDQREADIHTTANAKILKAQEQFQQEMTEIALRGDEAQEVGYAHIEAAAERSLERIKKDFASGYGQLAVTDPAREAAFAAEQSAFASIAQNTGRERVQMEQRDNLEIAKMNSETARAYLPPWLAAQEAIRAQFDETAQKANASLAAQLAYFTQVAERQHGLTTEQAAAQQQVWNQYYQTITADAARANAEMEKQQEQTRDKLSGELSSLFDNPAKYMEERGKKIMMDMLANWVLQLTEAKGPMGNAMSVLFGMNPEMSTSTNPKTALGSIFAPQHHGAAGAGGTATLSAAGSTLSSAGSTLNAAGSTLSSSGTMLVSAAQSLTSAAMAVGSMTAQAAEESGAASGGGGDFTGMFGGGGAGGGFQPSDINPAPTGATGVMGVPPGMAALFGGAMSGGISQSTLGSGGGVFGSGPQNPMTGGTGAAGAMGAAPGMTSAIGGSTAGAIGQATSLFGTLASGGVFGSGVQGFMTGGTGAAPLLNPNGVPGVAGGFQPTDIAPTNDAGVPGTPPSGASGGSGFGMSGMQIAGMSGAAAAGTMSMMQDWKEGHTGAAVGQGAMTGMQIGSNFGPIGMGIGAAVGALVGLIGSELGNKGASLARVYNWGTVVPTITKEMTAYTAAEVGYDQGMQDMQTLQMQAYAQIKKWGSGAMAVYKNTIAPEINAAISEMQRQQDTDRSGAITMQAAQYDSGGVIRHFGDLSTGPNSGFIHAELGERMVDKMTNMRHGSTISALSRGADISRGTGIGLGGNSGGGGGEVHFHVHAIDAQDTARWLRSYAAQMIQSHLNANANRYAGKALS